ncbi:MAG: hypothetical protein JXB20_03365 [Bacilli bacterium]|nr:hypothetical protein [Bacilli bacterium]
MFLAVLVVQEQLLVLLPNIQLTAVLLMVYAAVLPSSLLGVLVFAYVLLDSMLMGSLNLLYVIPMLAAWLTFVYVARLLRDRSIFIILIFAFLYGFVYGWFFIPAAMIERGIAIAWPYFLADLPFEIVMAVNNYFTVLLLYPLLKNLLKPLTDSYIPRA